jgi:hypothetical protein
MGKTNTRLEAARRVYREALDAARASPTPEAWAKLLAAGKELSAAQELRTRTGRRSRRAVTPTIHDLEEPAASVKELETLE